MNNARRAFGARDRGGGAGLAAASARNLLGWFPDAEEETPVKSLERSIEVEVPVRTAYNQWTQFEDFPNFMENVEEVRQLDDQTLEWRAVLGGKTERWRAEITEQKPDERIAWRSTSGATHAGVVTFHHLSDDRCKVMLQMDYEPEGFVENLGDLIGVTGRRVKGDLERFKKFIEARGRETGAYRGEIG